MKIKLHYLLTLLLITGLLASCGTSSSIDNSDDDSWKSKQWNDMSGSEQRKAYNYIYDLLEDAGIN